MKLALSNALCPELSLDALIERAKNWGYAGIELTGVHGSIALIQPAAKTLDPAAVRKTFADAGLTLIALHTGLSFGHSPANTLESRKSLVRETIDLAAEIGCGCVVVSGARIPATATRALALEQTAVVLSELALEAAAKRVTLAIENAGAFATSRDLWFLRDAAGVPALRVCWNAVQARAAGDPPSLAIPRLAASIGFVHLADARFDGPRFEGHVELGKGSVGISKLIELLKGIVYDRWLCVHWPRTARDSLPPADELLPAAAAFLRSEIDKPVVELSAYKGDKQAPRFAPRKPDAAASESS